MMTGQASRDATLARMLFHWFDHPLIEAWLEADGLLRMLDNSPLRRRIPKQG